MIYTFRLILRQHRKAGSTYAVGAVAAASAGTAFFAYFLLYRSTRPAESTNFCLPV
jgi:hypothetical protein